MTCMKLGSFCLTHFFVGYFGQHFTSIKFLNLSGNFLPFGTKRVFLMDIFLEISCGKEHLPRKNVLLRSNRKIAVNLLKDES